MTSIRRALVPPPEVKSQSRPAVSVETPRLDPLAQAESMTAEHQRQRQSGKFPALNTSDGSRAAFENVPAVSLRDLQRGGAVQAPPDLSNATVFGRPVDPRSSHDLFWHYFGGRPSPTNNTEARAMMAEMAEKFGQHGFTVEPIEHERMDKVRITGPDGRQEVVDFIYAMGGQPGEQRLQWLAESAAPGPSAGGGVDAGFVQFWLSMFPPTNEGITKALEEIRKQPGYENTRILQHPERLDKLQFANGQVVDVIIGAGGPNPRWGWLPE